MGKRAIRERGRRTGDGHDGETATEVPGGEVRPETGPELERPHRQEVSDAEDVSPVEALVEDAIGELQAREAREREVSDRVDDALAELADIEENEGRERGKTEESFEGKEEHARQKREFGEIGTKEEFDVALSYHPEVELKKSFQEQLEEVVDYYNGNACEKPSLLSDLEYLELRRKYVEANGGLPDIEMDSIQDLNELIKKHRGDEPVCEKSYEQAETYFQIRNESGKSQHQLAEEYDCSQSKISNIQRGVEIGLIKDMRKTEEDEIIREWARGQDVSSEDSVREYEEPTMPIGQTGVYRVSPEVLRDSFVHVDSGEISHCDVVDAIEKMHSRMESSDSRVILADLSKSGLGPEELSKLRDSFTDERMLVNETVRERIGVEQARVGLVDDRLYVWIPHVTPNDMVSVWHTEYYYFESRDMASIVDEVGSNLELGDSRLEKLNNINELMNQMIHVDVPGNAVKIDGSRSRMSGEAVHLLRDVIDLGNKELESKVTKVTGINGHGGLVRPRLLEGKELETWRAGFIGAAVSDCHLRPKDSIVEYYEESLERLERFRGRLRELGQFENEPEYIERDRVYRLKLPNPYGRALIVWGVASGDKTIQNRGLSLDFREWSPEAKCRYSSEMTAEEGCISSGRCIWPRSNAVQLGTSKAAMYQFQTSLSSDEVQLIKDRGIRWSGDFEGEKNIPLGLIDALKKDSDSHVSEVANRLEESIMKNRNRLIDDERDLHADLGIEVTVKPVEITLYELSGRVSVKWEAKTSSAESTIRLAILCPPNHPEKEVALKKWLSTRKPEDIQRVLEEIENEGFDVSNDWRDYVT
ncbi:hypothetical protein EU524_00200 [Candidatus Thorarchaeota archaeon]|nr:MAG: hypothetical protein EU524_00200 [Candidatus Thorarchaeota archaeon]